MQVIEIRAASVSDLDDILFIYNQGIEDRIATLETELKTSAYMADWFHNHGERYSILAAVYNEKVIGWAALNRYSPRAAYDGVADLSIYIERTYRGRGIGKQLLQAVEAQAVQNDFHKIVLFTFPFNGLGLDGQFVDVMAMEKLFPPNHR
jgi:L-amino acid N-acyltransferase YncA